MSTSPERAFLVWLSERPWLIVKKHRPEVRAHIMKALQPEKPPHG